MLLKSDQPPSKCVQCGSEERRLLHHVRHRGIFRRLCTNCVLRHHPQSFCPTCFTVYPPVPSNDAILACSKCFSSSHSHCVTSYTKPYVCPICANPNVPVFKLKSVNEGNDVVDISNSGECRLMDRDAAKKLLCAARIAMNTMNKALVAARGEAERRAKDAAVARKRAREALERVAYMTVKDKYVKRESSGNVNGIVWENVVKSVGSSGNKNVVVVEEGEDKVMNALGAVELKEHETVGEGDVGLEITMDDDENLLVMDVDEHGSMSVNARIEGGLVVENGGVENVGKREDVVMGGVKYEENGNGEGRGNGV